MIVTNNTIILTDDEELKEEWKDVVNYENLYYVSSFGRVKKYYKNGNCLYMKHFLNQPGYPITTLFKWGARKNISTSRLVAIAFLSNFNNYPEVNHKNGVHTDNRVDNLEWCTPGQNIKHSYRELDHPRMRGSSNGNSKLTDDNVQEICDLLDNRDLTHKQIADKYNVTRALISAIHEGKTWLHLTRRDYVKPKHGTTKLSEDNVVEIYTESWKGELTSETICKKYGISESTVRNIKCGESWRETTSCIKLENKTKSKYERINK
jgi:hypothetical protein